MIDCVTVAGVPVLRLGKQAFLQLPLRFWQDVAFASGHANPEHRALLALKIRAREALSVAHWGEPDISYTRGLERLQLHGMQLGTQYSTSFCQTNKYSSLPQLLPELKLRLRCHVC